MALDTHPSNSILAVNATFRAVLLPSGTRVPTTYTIPLTATAPVAGATVLTFASITPAPSAQAPLLIEDGAILVFSGGKTAIAQNDVANVTVQTYTSGAGGTIKVKPLVSTTMPAGAATTIQYGLLEVLGIQGIDVAQNTNLISIRSQKSGLGNEQRPTMISYEYNLSGWVHSKSLGYSQVLYPAATTGQEMYAEFNLPDGRLITGTFGASNLQTPVTLDDVVKMTCAVYAQGVPTITFGN